LFPFSPALAGEELGLSPKGVAEHMTTVCARLGWVWERPPGVLYLPDWWRWNKPDNPNILRHCLNDLDSVPACPARISFAKNTKHLIGSLKESFLESMKSYFQHSFQEVTETLGVTFRDGFTESGETPGPVRSGPVPTEDFKKSTRQECKGEGVQGEGTVVLSPAAAALSEAVVRSERFRHLASDAQALEAIVRGAARGVDVGREVLKAEGWCDTPPPGKHAPSTRGAAAFLRSWLGRAHPAAALHRDNGGKPDRGLSARELWEEAQRERTEG